MTIGRGKDGILLVGMLDANRAALDSMRFDRPQQVGLGGRKRMARLGRYLPSQLLRGGNRQLVVGNQPAHRLADANPSAAPTSTAKLSQRPVSSQAPNRPAGAFSRTDSPEQPWNANSQSWIIPAPCRSQMMTSPASIKRLIIGPAPFLIRWAP